MIQLALALDRRETPSSDPGDPSPRRRKRPECLRLWDARVRTIVDSKLEGYGAWVASIVAGPDDTVLYSVRATGRPLAVAIADALMDGFEESAPRWARPPFLCVLQYEIQAPVDGFGAQRFTHAVWAWNGSAWVRQS